MGQEAVCSVRHGSRVAEGKALLETKSLIFRGGEFRLNIPYDEMKSVEAGNGTLRIRFGAGVTEFDLGPKADKWAAAILHPKGLLDKLGVKAGMTVAAVGSLPDDFAAQLRARGCRIVRRQADLTCLFVKSKTDLKKLDAGVAPVWVVYPKGQQHITQADVMAAGKTAGLVDIKVASFSETHTALKFTELRAQ